VKCAIAAGKIVIVAVGWESNREIVVNTYRALRDGLQKKRSPQDFSSIGHYVVVVGYDAMNLHILDPASKSAYKVWDWGYFLEHWNQGNFAVEVRSMWAIGEGIAP